jgi:chromate reductase
VLRPFLVPFQPRVLPGPEVHLADSGNQFDENGHLKGDLYLKTLGDLMQNLKDEIDRAR